MDQNSDDDRSIIGEIKQTTLSFLNAITSKAALRTYLNTFLFLCLTISLLGASTVAYLVLYNRYIPNPQIEKVIHLQFGNTPHPYGTAHLPPSSVSSLTPYDIAVSLHLPRTPINIAAGNFMLDVSLHGPSQDTSANALTGSLPLSHSEDNRGIVIAHARRPAILTYASPLVDKVSTFTWLTFYLFGWSTESERLRIPIFEGVEFNRGAANLPRSITVTIQAFQGESAQHVLQVYECHVKMVAKLGGLRWLMYKHRILSYVVFTGFFWITSVTTFAVTYLTVTLTLRSSSGMQAEAKQEALTNDQDFYTEKQRPVKSEESLSDTPCTFPGLGRGHGGAAPLRYPDSRVKQEEEEDITQSTILQPLEADDEDEGFEEGSESFRDSGIGTGRDDAGERIRSVQRRRAALSEDGVGVRGRDLG